MNMKANAETVREILWAMECRGIEMPDRRTLDLIARAPASALEWFRPDAFSPDYRDAGDVLQSVGRLRRGAATLRRIAESMCNGIPRYDATARRVLNTWTDADTERAERDGERARAAITGAARVIFLEAFDSVEIETGGDPRGAVVKIWPKGERDRGSPIWSA